MKRILLIAVFAAGFAPVAQAQAVLTPDLTKINDRTVWQSATRTAEVVTEAGQTFARINAVPGENAGICLLGSNFTEGTIEVEMRGRNVPGASFVGISFRVLNDSTYDAVYFRPFNFMAENPVNRGHAVQYTSNPQFPWPVLRANKPEQYEDQITPTPDPGSWFKVKIVVDGDNVSVFVNDYSAPTLAVTALSNRRGGMVGLWTGNNSPGDFRNLRITPKDP
jgi:hypothetical protein